MHGIEDMEADEELHEGGGGCAEQSRWKVKLTGRLFPPYTLGRTYSSSPHIL